MRMILASSSPRRQELLTQIGLRFEVLKPEIDETRQIGEGLVDYAERLSVEKAWAVARMLDGGRALVIAADTIVIDHEGELLGKPADEADARFMLRHLRSRAHQVLTAFSLHRTGDPPKIITGHARTTVHMRDYSDEEIDAYIASGDSFDKAGGYAIQNADFHPVARIDGSYSNVVGLPLGSIKSALIQIGFSPSR
ncbi:MAG: Maf family protein [Chloroflexota bacterium]|nr:Maf family protein [Chloroflexota bacterium]MDE2946475.1 Maf family protein [Chloroflexota bacterium]